MRARRTRGFLLALCCSVAILCLAFLLRAGDTGPAAADLRNGRAFIQDNLWSTDHHQYAVWTTPDGEPLVARRDRGTTDWTVASLASVPGNPLASPAERDLHNVHVIGVDDAGYVHVAGNMHADRLRYVRSVRPGDISQWRAATVAGPAERVTYPMFVALPDGTLLFARREGDPDRGDILLDALPPGSQRWEHRGVIVSGSASEEAPYLHRIAVDSRSGMLHLLVIWRDDADPSSNDDVSHARSPDGGRTWERSDGTPIVGPVTHRSAELVWDTPEASGLVNNGGLALDARGRPHAVVALGGGGGSRSFTHLWHDGGAWRRAELPRWRGAGRPGVIGRRDGTVWLVGSLGRQIVAWQIHPAHGSGWRRVAGAPRGWEPTFDSQALSRTGRAEILVPLGSEPAVHVVAGQAR